MKLSMYLLQTWFQNRGFKVQAAIRNGDLCLKGARISNDPPVKAMAYIKEMDPEFGMVSIGNDQDMLIIMNTTGDEILNISNEAFEYYTAWETSMLQSAFQGATLQELLDEAQLAIMRPMLIKNWHMKLCAITDSYGYQTHPLWAAYLEQVRGASTNDYFYPAGRTFNEESEISTQRTPQIAFSPTYNGNFMYANLWNEDYRVGYISAYEHNRPFGPGDLQLMRVFQNIVNFYVNAFPNILFTPSVLEEYMRSALSENPGKYLGKDVYSINHWEKEDMLAVIVLHPRTALFRNEQREMIETLEARMQPIQVVLWEDEIVALINLRLNGPYSKIAGELSANVDHSHFSWGLSHEFQKLRLFRQHYQMARSAALRAVEKKQGGFTMRQCAPTFLLQEMSKGKSLQHFMHPAYFFLRQYDTQNNTQYVATLFWYLYYNRNLMDASARIGVHRNTVDNRISKITELLSNEDFQDDNAKFLYLLTCLLEQPDML